MKKMSRRNITSVIDDMEKVSRVLKERLSGMGSCVIREPAGEDKALRLKNYESGNQAAGSLRWSMNSMVFVSIPVMTLLTRETRKL